MGMSVLMYPPAPRYRPQDALHIFTDAELDQQLGKDSWLCPGCGSNTITIRCRPHEHPLPSSPRPNLFPTLHFSNSAELGHPPQIHLLPGVNKLDPARQMSHRHQGTFVLLQCHRVADVCTAKSFPACFKRSEGSGKEFAATRALHGLAEPHPGPCSPCISLEGSMSLVPHMPISLTQVVTK